MIKELKPYLIGWRGYFGFCQTPRVLTNLEAWIRRRLRLYLWRQLGNGHKPLQGTAPSWRSKVQCRGCRRLADGILAYVRAPGGPTGPAQPVLRVTRSPPSLCLCPSLTGRTAVVRDPYARWCGRGGAARRPPIPINPS
ncbi:group II intron maturase-specific domain-containing protein [Mesorhizobium sp. M0012]|uniref:group II intron maturase-specific domain-containing protein n=1 Tax=Mesorhizobium sp. M0012 TaxID=2956840 RepID=UPI003337E235